MKTWHLLALFLSGSLHTSGDPGCYGQADADGDEWNACGAEEDPYSQTCDCNDSNSSIYPTADETNSGSDDDCDGMVEWGIDFIYQGWAFEDPSAFRDGKVLVSYSEVPFAFTSTGENEAPPHNSSSTGQTCVILDQISSEDGVWIVSGVFFSDQLLQYVPCLLGIDPDTNEVLFEGSDLPPDAVILEDLIQTRDGGFVVVGAITLPDEQEQAIVIKVDSVGKLLWQRTYDQPSDREQRFEAVAETPSQELMVHGTNWTANPETGSWVLRLDSSGGVKWRLSNEALGGLFIRDSVACGRQDECVLIGRSRDTTTYYLLAYDFAGDLLWQWSSSELFVTSIVSTAEGGFLAATVSLLGDMVYYPSTSYFSADGQAVWLGKELGIYFTINEIRRHPQGGYLLSGVTDWYSPWDPEHSILLRLDKEANEVGLTSMTYGE